VEAEGDGIRAFSDENARDILEDIRPGSAVAPLLWEHHWAGGARDAPESRINRGRFTRTE
jgi:hypothetical protein